VKIRHSQSEIARRPVSPVPRFSVSPVRLGPWRPVSPVHRFSVSLCHSVPLSLKMSKVTKVAASRIMMCLQSVIRVG
jgi:hypothetical protein